MPLSRPWIPLSRSSKSFRSSITLRCSDLILSPLSLHPFLYSSHLDCQRILTTDRSRVTCHHCGRFGHMEKDCRRKLGLCLRCGKAGHVAKDCNGPEKVRKVEIEDDEEKQEQGFVEDL